MAFESDLGQSGRMASVDVTRMASVDVTDARYKPPLTDFVKSTRIG